MSSSIQRQVIVFFCFVLLSPLITNIALFPTKSGYLANTLETTRHFIPGNGDFSDDFEDGTADGWHAKKTELATEWSVEISESSYWLHHSYTGSSNGHTDGNQFICDLYTIDLSNDLVIEYLTKCSWNNMHFGIDLVSLDEGPSYNFGRINQGNRDRFQIFDQEATYVAQLDTHYQIRVEKTGNHYSGYINGALLLSFDASYTGQYELAFTSRGYSGTEAEASLDWVSAISTTPTQPIGIPGFPATSILLGLTIATTFGLIIQRRRRKI